MQDLEDKISVAKDKIVGGVKEVVGKASGNQELELKGKIQSFKADINETTNIGDRVEEIKESVAGMINDSIDKLKDNKKKNNPGKTNKR
jgi:uncharacterized protein YjbJ (UPF0337 family)